MDNISFLTPAFTSENDKITSLEQLKQEVESKFGSLNFTAYKLVPLTADDNLKEISNFVISSGQSPSVKDVSNTAHKVEQLEATLARAKSALKLAHNAPNPQGIKDCVYSKFPQLKKGK